jgi:riboflavin kinase/FMN adenylyltransferase
MKVHSDLSNLPLFRNAVITIGTFDGVHTGHLQILHQLKKEAGIINGESVIITFHPHPRMIISASQTSLDNHYDEIKLLNTLSEKIELLEKQNIDHLVIVQFTKEFSQQSARQYIKDFLVAKFHPHTIIIGYDHHFGKNRQGDYKLLESYQSECNFKVKEIPEHILHNITISSTTIRHALAEGDISTANEYLGYLYFFEGIVIEGDKIGRTLGYPTANISVTDKNKLIPANGIYAVELAIGKEQIIDSASPDIIPSTSYSVDLQGMMSIGIRPTVGGTNRVIEVNIFDFDKMIYGETVRVYVKYFLRDEVKFSGLETLKEAIANDKIHALKLLNGDQL